MVLAIVETEQPQRRRGAVVRRWLPWLVAIAILAVIAARIPFAAFRGAIAHGPHVVLATVDLAVTAAVLGTDSLATWIGLIALRLRRPLGHVLAVRGATNVLMLLNYALGQGAFGYYLHRTGVRPLRAVGATLFLMGTNLATLLLVTAVAWAIHPVDAGATLWWTLVIGCGGFVGYLGVIAWAPRFLAGREALAPLFDAGIRGHLVAVAGRIPHAVAIVLGIWVAMRAWDIPVPFVTGVAMMPVVVIASVLPIAPAGLGTTQAAFVYFYAAYAPGATADERAASVLAFSIVHFVYAWLASILIGLVCAPFARRATAAASAAPSAG